MEIVDIDKEGEKKDKPKADQVEPNPQGNIKLVKKKVIKKA
jgi:hypothetical protein